MTSDDHAAYFDANRANWDDRVPIHVASRGYDRDGFLQGAQSLLPVELAEVGDVRGKPLLHLQCHFGIDTLSWARLGATVTGLDFSEPAIEAARELSRESGVPGRFVCADVYDAADVLPETFDVVFSNVGSLCWLSDVRRWARVAARLVRPGGFLYLHEGHPVLWSLDAERDDGALVVTAPYFETPEPLAWDEDVTYTDGDARLAHTRTYEWNHGLGEIVTAIIEAGLRVDFVHEHRELAYRHLPWMQPAVPGDGVEGALHTARLRWRLPDAQRDLVPLMYSLRATREG